MVMDKSKLTSVKILEDLYKRFKSTTVNTKMTLQKLTNRSIDLYLTDKRLLKLNKIQYNNCIFACKIKAMRFKVHFFFFIYIQRAIGIFIIILFIIILL